MIPPIDSAEDFETYVQFVYEKLLNLTGEGIQVAHRTKLKGRSQGWYEIDVYYEFMRAEVVHRVAFECKYWNRKVERDSILAFHSKLVQLAAVALPNPAKRGEPFWVVMEKATASYWMPGHGAAAKSIPLFIVPAIHDCETSIEAIPQTPEDIHKRFIEPLRSVQRSG